MLDPSTVNPKLPVVDAKSPSHCELVELYWDQLFWISYEWKNAFLTHAIVKFVLYSRRNGGSYISRWVKIQTGIYPDG